MEERRDELEADEVDAARTVGALVRGEGCPLCREIQSSEDAQAWGYTIAERRVSRFRLQANEYVTVNWNDSTSHVVSFRVTAVEPSNGRLRAW